MTTLEMLRRFLADISDEQAGMWLATRGRRVGAFAEQHLDLLTKPERLRFYGLMEGFFSQQFERILAARLLEERDPQCLELLRAISAIERKGRKGTEKGVAY